MTPLHVDTACLVVVKPAGLLSVPGRGEHLQDCLSARAQALCADALVVHRLDMATSGLMLFARGAAAQRSLSQAFAQREVHKRYVAVVHGRMAQDEGVIDLPLMADWPNRPMQKIDMAHGKPSLTRYRVLAFDAATNTTRVALEPVTGRAHQLRVHLLAIGHPMLGDALYAPPPVLALANRLLLHAESLAFPHPTSGSMIELNCDVPF
ncbi:MAG: RluA family pseudouridine synthase [Rhizobacter sp.]|nr:RluA family pseudouridine synthase [Rhizobacter sp.]